MPHPSSDRPLVFVVDDDASVRRALYRSLTAAGYDVRSLATGAELLASVLPEDLACAVIDVHLPDMSGMALLQHLRASRDGSVPVVLITADGDPRLKAEAERKGAAAFLTKPFEEARLLDELRNLLDGHRDPKSAP